jgi:hypothetical protein
VTSKKGRLHAPQQHEDLVGQSLLQIAAILLRIGIDAPQAERKLRHAFILAAQENAIASGVRVTQSQIASLAGISRLEVRTALTKLRSGRSQPHLGRRSRIDQIVDAWRSDPQFLDAHRRPKQLSVKGHRSGFHQLVKKYGRDVTPTAIRNQLILRGFATEQDGILRLSRGADHQRQLSSAADLQFLTSQLSDINFQIGRRAYTTRRVAITSSEPKSVRVMRRIALERINAVLNSISELPLQNSKRRTTRSGKDSIRILITATVATEEDSK